MLIFWIIILVMSLAVLVKSSDFFTDSAEKLGLYMGFSPFLIGVTIVAIGTSLPELITSVISVIRNSSEIVSGNVVGSNIANILLVVGILAIISKKITLEHEIVKIDLPIFVASSFIFLLVAYDGKVNLAESIILIAATIVYLLYVSSSQKKRKIKEEAKEIKSLIKEDLEPKKSEWIKDLAVLIMSASFIYLGAEFTVKSAINISEIINIGKEIVGLSAIALGTSLPELVVSLSAIRNKKPDISLGNILGSNIFNLTAVVGISGIFGKITVPDTILLFGVPVMIMSTLLYFFVIQDQEITIWEGSILIILYILFIGNIFGLL